MNVILFIASKNKGYASIAKKFCHLMKWNPLIINLENSFNFYEKEIEKLVSLDIIITAGFRDNMIFLAKKLKEKYKTAKLIQLGNPRNEELETLDEKEIKHIDIIVDWENSVNKKTLPENIELISFNRPPSNFMEKKLKEIYKAHLHIKCDTFRT